MDGIVIDRANHPQAAIVSARLIGSLLSSLPTADQEEEVVAGMSDESPIWEKANKYLAAYAIASSGIRLVVNQYKKVRSETVFTVSLSNKDVLYPDVALWLLRKIPQNKQRALIAEYRKRDEYVSDTYNSSLSFFYDGTRSQHVFLDGHRIRVSVVQAETESSRKGLTDPREQIMFTARTIEGREAIIKFLQGIAANQVKNCLYIARSWGGDWSRTEQGGSVRPIESVILRKDQKERLIKDMDSFLHREADYTRLGVSYHRGYLFHGPPGTGKTSLAKALATHFGLDVYYASLSHVSNDAALAELVSDCRPRSILLLEDIDIVHASRERDDAKKGVTLSGLLNVLDGVITPHGLITVMTTNNRAALDPALLRPGRVDFDEKLDYIDVPQLNKLVEAFCGTNPGFKYVTPETTPAAVVELVLKNLDDPQKAVQQIEESLCRIIELSHISPTKDGPTSKPIPLKKRRDQSPKLI